MPEIVLSTDQQVAYDALMAFISSPVERVFVLKGYSGTGKSTLVTKILDDLPNVLKTLRLLDPNNKRHWDMKLTATTNKAAEALSSITGDEVSTIQSTLGLRVDTDWKTGETRLIPRGGAQPVTDTLLFVDEASFIDRNLLQYIFKLTDNCKIVFIGDPAQITPVKSSETPVFSTEFSGSVAGAELTEVVRQAEGNPIIELSTLFRHTVNSGQFFSFVPDGESVIHLPRDEFEQAIINEFTREDWRHQDSKVLVWRNKTVIAYNHAIRNLVAGLPELQKGDYAICNQYIGNSRCKVKTDQMVQITDIYPSQEHGVDGYEVTMDKHQYAFLPRDPADTKAAIKNAQANKNYGLAQYIRNHWIDLRAAYACTINKSQGSTYDRVFIDLDDIRQCHNGNQIARMLYVAVSRARYQVFLTGDLVA